MESLLPILIGVAFIILQAVNANKKKEAAKRKVVTPQHSQTTTPPVSQNPFEEWIKAMRQETELVVEEGEEELESQVEEEKLYPVKSAKPAEAPMNSLAEMTTSQEISEEERAAFAENTGKTSHPFIEEFDIRKAVVYSEILRPKFD